MYELALALLAIFGVPAAVIALLFMYTRRAGKLRREFGLGEIAPSRPAIDEIVAQEGDLVLSKRTDIVEALIDIDRANSYGKTVF